MLTTAVGVAAAAGMFVVLVMGATVTDTGSAQGCGQQWPLCRGQFIPTFAVSTLIEFSHRAVTAVESVLILALAALALLFHHRRRPVQVLVPLMLLALAAQAGLGAAAVMWPEQPAVLALHFGVSLIALASTTLVAVLVTRAAATDAATAAPGWLRAVTWAALLYLYVLVYTGAYVRHAGAAPACPSWPFCGSAALNPAPGEVAVNLLHRVAAGGAVLIAVGLLLAYVRLRPARPDLVRAGWLALAAVLAQAGAGAYLVATHWTLFGELAHAAVSGLYFTAAAYCALRVLQGRPAAALEGAPDGRRLAPPSPALKG